MLSPKLSEQTKSANSSVAGSTELIIVKGLVSFLNNYFGRLNVAFWGAT